jgi:hypothetical protein
MLSDLSDHRKLIEARTQELPALPGRLLCTMSSVQPDQHGQYPWINHPDPLMPDDDWNFDNNYLMLGDMGCIYVSIDEPGQLHWSHSCF